MLNNTRRVGLFIFGLVALFVAYAPIAPVEHIDLELVRRHMDAATYAVIGVFAIGTSILGRDQRS
jgi:accessory gene regulator protein AgrB